MTQRQAGRAEQVLAQLDQAATEYLFPDLSNGYNYAVDARLRAFGDPTRWALVVETVGYNPRAVNLIDIVHTFGDCITAGGPGYENADFHSRIDNMDEIESRDDPEIHLGSAPLIVRGRAVQVDAPNGEELYSTFRRLVPAHRDLLLGDEAEVRRRVPIDLPQILQLEEWNQPDLFETAPSQSEAYRLIALVLESLDPTRYRPTTPPNTHWSNWPDSGSL
ncbi:MAG: hypothetical protein H0T40_09320 [Geodermatophilaceae bacterium]|jgi:hypothetical protein|nr:hypothetical protein [Geodermatophilaceae bacterium]